MSLDFGRDSLSTLEPLFFINARNNNRSHLVEFYQRNASFNGGTKYRIYKCKQVLSFNVTAC